MEREWMKRNHADRDNGCISSHLCRLMTENQMQPLFGCKRHRCDWPQEGPKLSFLYRSEGWRAWSQIIKLNWKKKKKEGIFIEFIWVWNLKCIPMMNRKRIGLGECGDSGLHYGEWRELSCTQVSMAGHWKANPYISVWVVLPTVPTRMVGGIENWGLSK